MFTVPKKKKKIDIVLSSFVITSYIQPKVWPPYLSTDFRTIYWGQYYLAYGTFFHDYGKLLKYYSICMNIQQEVAKWHSFDLNIPFCEHVDWKMHINK